MTTKCYFIFDNNKSIKLFEIWGSIAKNFDQVFGCSFFGDMFLIDSKSGQCGILYNMPPELVDLECYGKEIFLKEFLPHETIKRDLLQVDKVNEIESRIGVLTEGEVYIPQPYPFLGGDCSVESYEKGSLDVFMDLIGQLQLN